MCMHAWRMEAEGRRHTACIRRSIHPMHADMEDGWRHAEGLKNNTQCAIC